MPCKKTLLKKDSLVWTNFPLAIGFNKIPETSLGNMVNLNVLKNE